MNFKHCCKVLILLLLCLSLAIPTFALDLSATEPFYTKTALPEEVTQVVDAGQGYAVVQNALGAYAMLDAAGTYCIPFGAYLWIDTYSENLARVKVGTASQWSWGFVDLGGNLVLTLSGWEEVGSFHNGLARVKSGSRCCFVNTDGAVALDCSQYQEVGEFSDGFAKVALASGSTLTYGFIDTSGNTIIGGLQSATDFSGGYALVELYNTLSRKTVTCLLDTTGTTTVDLSAYTNLSAVSDGLMLVNPQEGHDLDCYGYLDRTGEIVISCPTCEFVYPFSDGLALTEYLDPTGNLCYAYLDTAGNTFLDLGSCQIALPYEDGYAICEKDGTWYLLNTDGAAVYASSSYLSFESCSEGVLVAARSNGAGGRVYDLLTVTGTPLVTGLAYDRIDAFSDALALATRYDAGSGQTQYVFLDAFGTVVLDCSAYDDVGSFSEGKVWVSTHLLDSNGHFAGTKTLFLDKTGAVVLDCSGYSSVESFSDGLALVSGNDSYTLAETYQFIDAAGQVVLDCSSSAAVTSFREGVSILSRSTDTGTTQYALIDTSGAMLTDWLDVSMVSGYAEGYAVVHYTAAQEAVSDYFYMNTDGTTVLSDLGYASYTDFSDGLAIVGWGGQYGCIDKTGKLVIDLQYDRILPFSQGVTWARQNGTWYCLVRTDASAQPAASLQKPVTFEPEDDLPFTDVAADAWYRDAVCFAYDNDLITGITPTTFDPDSSLTLAQAITLALRVYCQYYQLEPVSAGTGLRWYQPYVDAAIHAGILTGTEFPDYLQPATRAELAYLFARILPETCYEPQSSLPAISDVFASQPYASEILTLYRAGILTGYDDGTFRPNNTVRRCEVAAILARLLLPEQRAAS